MAGNLATLCDSDIMQPYGCLSESDWTSLRSTTTIEEHDSEKNPWRTTCQPRHHEPRLRIKVLGKPPLWLEYVGDKLNKLLSLPANWDSYGAERIDLQAAITTLQLLTRLMSEEIPLPDIVPVNNGGIQVEWHTQGIDIEIEIPSSGNIQYYFEDLSSNAEPIENDIERWGAISSPILQDFVERLVVNRMT